MKHVCSGYSKHSSICNCRFKGKCSIAEIESDSDRSVGTRCPRQPWIDKKDKYVYHTTKGVKE